MNKKVWLSNGSITDAAKIAKAFPGVTIGIPRADSEQEMKALCKENIAGLYASEERARELMHVKGKR